MNKQFEALKPQAFELLIANGHEMANQLRHLADNEIDSDSFAVVIENYNGAETEFERPITELALQAAATFDELIAALVQSQQQVINEQNLLSQLSSNADADICDLRKRIAELEALTDQHPVATLYKSGDGAKVIMVGSDLPDGYSDVYAFAAASQLAVKLPNRLQPGADGPDDWYLHSDPDGEYMNADDVIEAIRAAGGTVEGYAE